MRLFERAVSCALLVASSGCLSANAYRSARALPPGRSELVASANGYVFPSPTEQDGGGSIGVHYRTGIARKVELGISVNTGFKATFDGLVQVVDAGPFALALNPEVFVGALRLADAESGVTLGAGLITRTDLWLGPGFALVAHGGPVLATVADSTGGLAQFGGGFRVFGPKSNVGLQAEVTTLWDASVSKPLDTTFGLGLIIQYGRREQTETRLRRPPGPSS